MQKRLGEIDQRLEDYLIEKNDFEKDINGLRELLRNFSKNKQNIQYEIDTITRNTQDFKQTLTEIELEQIHIQKQIVNCFVFSNIF